MSTQSRPGLPPNRMNVDEYLAWAETAPGRYELVDGVVVAMSPERSRHAEVKFAAQIALRAAIRGAGVPCRTLPDGMTVRVDERTAYEPDALVYCGERNPPAAVEVPAPIVVVEVLSPGTRNHDVVGKLAGYFKVASLVHYLIVDADREIVVHHRRGDDDRIETRIASDGALDLDPPGLTIAVADLFAEP